MESAHLNGHASEDLNFTLVAWPLGSGVAPHINREVDVLIVVLEGSGIVTIDEGTFSLIRGAALLIPKGSTRAVQSTSEQFVYFSIHRRRAGFLQIETGRGTIE